MTNHARRLVFFFLGQLVTLLALEWLVRRNEHLFAAASHRALTKVAMFETHRNVELLFLGTSRTQDGVSPALVAESLKGIAPGVGALPGFNAAFTGSSLDSLISLAPRFSSRTGLRLVVVEFSAPQIINEPVSWEEPAVPDGTLEDKLALAARNIRFIRYRKAFIPENLNRLPKLLLFAPSLGGWETRTSDQIAAWLGRKETPAANFDPAKWSPELFTPAGAPMPLDQADERIASAIQSLIRQFEGHGIKVAFAVPPLSRSYPPVQERDRMRALFSEVARRGRCEVWNFASLSLPDGLFRDPSHLGVAGRAEYSAALAKQVARILRNE